MLRALSLARTFLMFQKVRMLESVTFKIATRTDLELVLSLSWTECGRALVGCAPLSSSRQIELPSLYRAVAQQAAGAPARKRAPREQGPPGVYTPTEIRRSSVSCHIPEAHTKRPHAESSNQQAKLPSPADLAAAHRVNDARPVRRTASRGAALRWAKKNPPFDRTST